MGSDAKDPMAIPADLGFDENCKRVVHEVVNTYGRIDILVNNAAEQYKASSVEEIDEERLLRLFRTNIFSYFFMCRHSLKHMREGSSIINTTSVNAYKGNAKLLDYTATKGAIVAFTRGLALQLVSKGIRVNGVAPGPIWTPLIPASFDEEESAKFGSQVPMKRAGQPSEVAPCYVFLACNADSSYITGQVLHPNGMSSLSLCVCGMVKGLSRRNSSECMKGVGLLVVVVFVAVGFSYPMIDVRQAFVLYNLRNDNWLQSISNLGSIKLIDNIQ
ncbi:hypothetical protein ACSBR2_018168 [Camellia fascicularis]